MLFFVVACLTSSSSYVSASSNNSENATDFFNTTTSVNITVVGNGSVELERIVQPLSIPPTNLSVSPRIESGSKPKDFRPSPQLETYYEYNKVPVAPAFPEAKRFSSLIAGETPIASRPWVGFERTTETAAPWASKVRFPATSKDYPYPFVTNHPVSSTESPEVKYGPPNFDFPVQVQQKIPDTITPALYSHFPPVYGEPSRYGGLQYESIDKFERGPPASVRRPILGETNFGLGEISRPSGDVVSGITWKKIVKFLTAAIPIGILISALTPSVINVSPVNVTMRTFWSVAMATRTFNHSNAPIGPHAACLSFMQKNRARSGENESRSNRKLITSLNFVEDLRSRGCEERILCELLISAGASGNAERNAENLLDAFMQQEGNIKKKSDELERIMGSVRKENCDAFVCRLESRRNKRKLN